MASRVVCMKRFHQQAFLKIGVLLRFCSRDSFWIKILSFLGNTQLSLTSSFLSKAFCVNINVHFSINRFFLILAHQPFFFDQCHVFFSKSFRSCTHVCGNTWPNNYIITECPLDCVSFRSWESHCRMRWPKPESGRQRNLQTNKIHSFFIQCSVGSPRTAPKQKNNVVWNSTGLLRFLPKILGALTL